MQRTILFISILAVALPSNQLRSQEGEEIRIETLSGVQIYALFCARCHAADGTGNIDPELIAGMEAPPPDFTDPYFSSREKRKDWKAVIAHGGAVRGLSMSMPAWGHVLSEQQIEEIVEYIKGFVDQRRYPQGELNFIRGHSTTKAFVEQEALLIPTYQSKRTAAGTTTETKITAYYANRFNDRFQYEAKLPLHRSVSPTTNAWGIGDLELGLKYALHDDHKTMTILSIAFEAGLPTGDTQNGFSAGTFMLTPIVTAGKGIGDIIQLSGSAKLEMPLNASRGDPELQLSILSMLTLQESKQGFFPGCELLVKRNLKDAEQSISVTPQLYWGITARGHLAISLGAELPLSGPRAFDRRIVAFVLWDYVDGGLWW